MNVRLISANTETITMPTLPMGLGMGDAAARKAGHRIRFLDLMAETDPERALAAEIDETRPNAIGIPIRNIDDQNSAGPRFLLSPTRGVVARCKALSAARVILGGAGYSMFPESVLDYLGADMGIQGEGEAPFVTLLDQIAAEASPYTRMAAIAREQGVIDAADDLRHPRLYIRSGLQDRLHGTIGGWTAERPHWRT